VKEQIPKIFGRCSTARSSTACARARGQQGIGISAAGMYGQLTTGRPVRVRSKIGKRPARVALRDPHRQLEEPARVTDKDTEWEKDHGTEVEIDMEGLYRGGQRASTSS
jgi:DNA topoisomerase-6 subunit B